MLTQPLRYEGRRLLLNYVVQSGGTLKIEILNNSGQVIGRAKPLSGEGVDVPVTWEKDPQLSQGIVRLRFTLKNADVYSLRFD